MGVNLELKDIIEVLILVGSLIAIYYRNLGIIEKKLNVMEKIIETKYTNNKSEIDQIKIKHEFQQNSINSLQLKMDELLKEFNQQSLKLSRIETLLEKIEHEIIK